MPDNLTELAERCATATGPNQTLDYCIAEVVDPDRTYSTPPRFTASIDAAMTLVPDGQRDLVMAETAQFKRPHVFLAVFDADKDYSKEEAYGDTIALALCAAALRIRAKGEDQ